MPDRLRSPNAGAGLRGPNAQHGPFRVVLDMEVDPDHAQEFQDAWESSALSFQDAEGLLAQTLAVDTGQPGQFTITSDWTDERWFRVFETSSSQDDATAPLRALRRSSSMRTQLLRCVLVRDPEPPAPTDRSVTTTTDPATREDAHR
jgi:quinol monooxygenase YgiN